VKAMVKKGEKIENLPTTSSVVEVVYCSGGCVLRIVA